MQLPPLCSQATIPAGAIGKVYAGSAACLPETQMLG